MKNLIKKIFGFIWHFIDKFIVTPITKLIMKINEVLDKNGKHLEKWITKKNTLIFISLFLSLIVFFMVDNKTIELSETSAEVIYNQPITYIYNKESYVVEGLPEKADITLIGRSSDLYLARQLSTHDITLDLSDLKPGTHKVSLKYKQSLSSIDYKLDPSVATVIIYPKKSTSKNITVDILNEDKLDNKLTIQDIKTNKENVIVKGSEHVLTKVATVKALLDVNNLTATSEGVVDVKDIPLKAYDEEGNIVDVELVPSKVSAKVTIASPHKEVAIKVIPKGKVVFGRALSNITPDVTKVTIYGDEAQLDKITYIPVEIDVEGLKENKEYTETIKKPNGIRSISSSKININVTLGDEVSKEVSGVRINPINLADGLVVNAASQEDITIPVIIKGVSSVLEGVDASGITASIDLDGLGVGEHEVEVKVEGNDLRVKYAPKTTKVKVNILQP